MARLVVALAFVVSFASLPLAQQNPSAQQNHRAAGD